jgi:hypothetical protein
MTSYSSLSSNMQTCLIYNDNVSNMIFAGGDDGGVAPEAAQQHQS